MNKETGIPEFLAGTLSSFFFFWLFPAVASAQNFIYTTIDGSKIENVSLILMGAYGVLIFGIYGVLGVYFFSRCAEKLYYRFKKVKPNA